MYIYFSVTAQPYRMVSPAAQPSGLMMYNVLEQRSVLMTAAMLDGGLKTVGLQRQLKLFAEVMCSSVVQLSVFASIQSACLFHFEAK